MAILDCGEAPGHAMAALRQGFKAIRYDGPAGEKIADIARRSGATVLRERPPTLELEDSENFIAACRDWLGAKD